MTETIISANQEVIDELGLAGSDPHVKQSAINPDQLKGVDMRSIVGSMVGSWDDIIRRHDEAVREGNLEYAAYLRGYLVAFNTVLEMIVKNVRDA